MVQTQSIDLLLLKTAELSAFRTCLSGMVMGFTAYNGSFALVPLFYTISAWAFGTKSFIPIIIAAFSQLLAGYVHTHASRIGIAISTRLFGGFYIAKATLKNRRQSKETRWHSIKRFFFLHPSNAIVINIMWETFTINYLLQSEFMMRYAEYSRVHSTSLSLDYHLLFVHGITRYLAGSLSGMSTGAINQLWQRYLAHQTVPLAVFNTDREKLKLKWNERKKLLSIFNSENWIKLSAMSLGASFLLLSNIPNITNLHLLTLQQKKFIHDFLVIHGGWFIIRDCQMLLLKKAEKIVPNVVQQIPLLSGIHPTIPNTDEQLNNIHRHV